MFGKVLVRCISGRRSDDQRERGEGETALIKGKKGRENGIDQGKREREKRIEQLFVNPYVPFSLLNLIERGFLDQPFLFFFFFFFF